jgi:hypothetical protein
MYPFGTSYDEIYEDLKKKEKQNYYSKHRFLVSQILSSLGLPYSLTFKSYFEMNSNFFLLKDETLYTKNGMLHIMERNRRIKVNIINLDSTVL